MILCGSLVIPGGSSVVGVVRCGEVVGGCGGGGFVVRGRVDVLVLGGGGLVVCEVKLVGGVGWFAWCGGCFAVAVLFGCVGCGVGLFGLC